MNTSNDIYTTTQILKLCLGLHRMVKSLDKAFVKLEESLAKEEYCLVVKTGMGKIPSHYPIAE